MTLPNNANSPHPTSDPCGVDPVKLCRRCCKRPTRRDDEFGAHDYCVRCEDDLIEKYNERREWDYYHND